MFQYDPVLSGAVAKHLLTERIDLLKPIGRKRRTGSKAMTDTDRKYIRLYLEDTYGLTSEKKIADAADLAADANSRHGAGGLQPEALFTRGGGARTLPLRR